MTGNYIYTNRYLQIIRDLVTDLTLGEITADMVKSVLITPEEGTVFEVFHYDREGRKIRLYDVDSDWDYTSTYYYRVTRVDALTSW